MSSKYSLEKELSTLQSIYEENFSFNNNIIILKLNNFDNDESHEFIVNYEMPPLYPSTVPTISYSHSTFPKDISNEVIKHSRELAAKCVGKGKSEFIFDIISIIREKLDAYLLDNKAKAENKPFQGNINLITGIIKNIDLHKTTSEQNAPVIKRKLIGDFENSVNYQDDNDLKSMRQSLLMSRAHLNKDISNDDEQPPSAIITNSRLRSNFDYIGRLGSGSFGRVYKVRNKIDKLEYAIKIIEVDEKSPDLEKTLTEVSLLSSSSNPNIVRYYQAWLEERDENNKRPFSEFSNGDSSEEESESGSSSESDETTEEESSEKYPSYGVGDIFSIHASTKDGEMKESNIVAVKRVKKRKSVPRKRDLFIQMELCQMTLGDWIERQTDLTYYDSPPVQANPASRSSTFATDVTEKPNSNVIPEHFRVRWRMFVDVLSALSYMHHRGTIHRDIKPGNILLDSDNVAKLSDFGLSVPHMAVRPVHKKPTYLDVFKRGNASSDAPSGADIVLRDEQAQLLSVGVGTMSYMAPEVLNAGYLQALQRRETEENPVKVQEHARALPQQRIVSGRSTYDSKVDIYSLAFVLMEIFHPPFRTHTQFIEQVQLMRFFNGGPESYDLANTELLKEYFQLHIMNSADVPPGLPLSHVCWDRTQPLRTLLGSRNAVSHQKSRAEDPVLPGYNSAASKKQTTAGKVSGSGSGGPHAFRSFWASEEQPLEPKPLQQMLQQFRDRPKIVSFARCCPPQVLCLIEAMMRRDPARRPSALQLLESPLLPSRAEVEDLYLRTLLSTLNVPTSRVRRGVLRALFRLQTAAQEPGHFDQWRGRFIVCPAGLRILSDFAAVPSVILPQPWLFANPRTLPFAPYKHGAAWRGSAAAAARGDHALPVPYLIGDPEDDLRFSPTLHSSLSPSPFVSVAGALKFGRRSRCTRTWPFLLPQGASSALAAALEGPLQQAARKTVESALRAQRALPLQCSPLLPLAGPGAPAATTDLARYICERLSVADPLGLVSRVISDSLAHFNYARAAVAAELGPRAAVALAPRRAAALVRDALVELLQFDFEFMYGPFFAPKAVDTTSTSTNNPTTTDPTTLGRRNAAEYTVLSREGSLLALSSDSSTPWLRHLATQAWPLLLSSLASNEASNADLRSQFPRAVDSLLGRRIKRYDHTSTWSESSVSQLQDSSLGPVEAHVSVLSVVEHPSSGSGGCPSGAAVVQVSRAAATGPLSSETTSLVNSPNPELSRAFVLGTPLQPVSAASAGESVLFALESAVAAQCVLSSMSGAPLFTLSADSLNRGAKSWDYPDLCVRVTHSGLLWGLLLLLEVPQSHARVFADLLSSVSWGTKALVDDALPKVDDLQEILHIPRRGAQLTRRLLEGLSEANCAATASSLGSTVMATNPLSSIAPNSAVSDASHRFVENEVTAAVLSLQYVCSVIANFLADVRNEIHTQIVNEVIDWGIANVNDDLMKGKPKGKATASKLRIYRGLLIAGDALEELQQLRAYFLQQAEGWQDTAAQKSVHHSSSGSDTSAAGIHGGSSYRGAHAHALPATSSTTSAVSSPTASLNQPPQSADLSSLSTNSGALENKQADFEGAAVRPQLRHKKEWLQQVSELRQSLVTRVRGEDESGRNRVNSERVNTLLAQTLSGNGGASGVGGANISPNVGGGAGIGGRMNEKEPKKSGPADSWTSLSRLFLRSVALDIGAAFHEHAWPSFSPSSSPGISQEAGVSVSGMSADSQPSGDGLTVLVSLCSKLQLAKDASQSQKDRDSSKEGAREEGSSLTYTPMALTLLRSSRRAARAIRENLLKMAFARTSCFTQGFASQMEPSLLGQGLVLPHFRRMRAIDRSIRLMGPTKQYIQSESLRPDAGVPEDDAWAAPEPALPRCWHTEVYPELLFQLLCESAAERSGPRESYHSQQESDQQVPPPANRPSFSNVSVLLWSPASSSGQEAAAEVEVRTHLAVTLAAALQSAGVASEHLHPPLADETEALQFARAIGASLIVRCPSTSPIGSFAVYSCEGEYLQNAKYYSAFELVPAVVSLLKDVKK